jgi:hypothetical protein
MVVAMMVAFRVMLMLEFPVSVIFDMMRLAIVIHGASLHIDGMGAHVDRLGLHVDHPGRRAIDARRGVGRADGHAPTHIIGQGQRSAKHQGCSGDYLGGCQHKVFHKIPPSFFSLSLNAKTLPSDYWQLHNVR